MGLVTVDITMSLDGFVAGPNAGVEFPLGEGGERLHQWVVGLESWREKHGLSGGKVNQDSEIQEEAYRNLGAFVMGRTMFDTGEEPWGEEPPFHAPVYVVTHRARPPLVRTGTTFYFVTDGIESALRQAKEAAGDKDVLISGGGNVVSQYLEAGLIDTLQVHVANVLIGQGARLFDQMSRNQIELETLRVAGSSDAAHLKYRIVK